MWVSARTATFIGVHPPLSFLAELVVLSHGLVDVPGAAQSLGKGDQIALADLHFALVSLDRYLSFQEIAGFLLVVVPVKSRPFLCPDWPGHDRELLEPIFIRSLDLDPGVGLCSCHGKPPNAVE